ncbi:MAG TPA: hypothetical protein PL096_04715 [Micropepsaceae bacterium]|nr:hypothetical protein [Micropepsaceae bacterium]
MRSFIAFAALFFALIAGAPARAEEASIAFDRFANGFGVPQGILAHDGAEWTPDGALFVRNLRIPINADAANPLNLISEIPLGDVRIANITYTGEVPTGYSVISTGAVIDLATLTQRAGAVLADPAIDPNTKLAAQMFQNAAAGIILFGYAQIPVSISFDMTYDEASGINTAQGTFELGNVLQLSGAFRLGNVKPELFVVYQNMMRQSWEALASGGFMAFLQTNNANAEAMLNSVYTDVTYEEMSFAISERGLFARLKPMIDASIAQTNGLPVGTPIPEEKIQEAIRNMAVQFQSTPEAVEPIVRAGIGFIQNPGTLAVHLAFDPPMSVGQFMEITRMMAAAPGQPPANPFIGFAEFTHLTVEYTAPQ